MITRITYQHFCNLGALRNPHCFSRWNTRKNETEYFYNGDLSKSCWMGYKL